MQFPTSLVAGLAAQVGPEHVLTDADLTSGFARDWTGRFVGRTPAVIRPGSTAEVAAVLSLLAEAGVAIVPQGGNTGLVGGGVPLHGEVVLSLQRLSDTGEVDARARQLTAGAGATLAMVAAAAAPSGLTLGVSIASRGSATVGGAISTNAGGVHMIRHGNMAAQVVGLEVVMADGTVLSHLGGLTKDNTGYPWHALLCGAEGTLAVVTRARLRLVTLLRERTVVLVGLASIDEAVSLAGALARDVPDLEAVELMLDAGMRLLHSQLDMPVPLARAYPVYLLAESASVQAGADALLACLTAHEVDDVAVGDDASGRDRLWEYRERHTEAINHAGVPLKLDLALPLGVYAEFVDTVPGAVASVAPGAACVCFGHIADGNVHVNVLHAERNAPAVEDTVFRLTARYGGSIAAEHGIGTAKKPWLHLCRSEAEMELGRRMKQLFDPRGVLNPHVLYG